MDDIFQGDPKIVIDENGADFVFRGGQPVMDQGFENHCNIALLTEKGWWGNDTEPIPERRVGGQFIETVKRGGINREKLIDSERAAEYDLKQGDEFGSVTAESFNPSGAQIKTIIKISPISNDEQTLLLTKSGQNWIAQRDNPAHERI